MVSRGEAAGSRLDLPRSLKEQPGFLGRVVKLPGASVANSGKPGQSASELRQRPDLPKLTSVGLVLLEKSY